MDWMPDAMWLSYLKVDALPSQLTYDLAVDATGAGQPSPVSAGLEQTAQPALATTGGGRAPGWPWAVAGAAALAVAAGGVLVARRR
jgi:hypothetical protein